MGHIGVRRFAAAAIAAVVLAGWVLVPAGGMGTPGASAATMHDTARTAAALSLPCAVSAAPGKPTCEILSSAPAARLAPGPAPGPTHLARPRASAAASACTASSTTPPGYDPAQLQDAYRLSSATSGSGTLVAVVAPYTDPTAQSDLCTYRAQYGLPACPAAPYNNPANGCFTEVTELGSAPAENVSWALQTSAQLDMISATCPNCRILLVETDSASIADLGAGVKTAVSMGADVVTLGVATGETSADTSYDSEFFDHPGVVITAAAGDDGYGVSYPAASPDVIAVGGTTLTPAGGSCAASARGWCESVWNDLSAPSGGATGSGCSAYEPKPSWQADTSCALRTDDDLSADADPDTGVAVYDSSGENGWQPGTGIGGTAVAAAIVAGAYALDGPSSGSPASFPYSHATADSINDLTSGNDLAPGTTCSPAYLCTAGPGYDGPTGLGSLGGTTALSSAGGLGGAVYSAKFGKCLDNSGGKLADANTVVIDTCNALPDYQQWIVEADGTIHLRSATGAALTWCLDVYHSGTADFTPVNLYNCNGGGAQQWLPQGNGEIINPESGLCLDDPNGTLTDGTQLQIRTCGDYSSQQWALPYARPPAQGQIEAEDTGACLDNNGSKLADGNQIDVLACNDGEDSQDWAVETDGTIKLPGGWCLDVYHSGDTSGSIVNLFACNGSGSQQWQQEPDGALVNPESGLCLTDPDVGGVRLEVQTCEGTANQAWTLPVPAPPS